MVTTRKKAKTTQAKLRGLLPDEITMRKEAVSKAKAICTYTTANSKNRRGLIKDRMKERATACERKKGSVFVCGYVTKNDKIVKPYCRKKPKK